MLEYFRADNDVKVNIRIKRIHPRAKEAHCKIVTEFVSLGDGLEVHIYSRYPVATRRQRNGHHRAVATANIEDCN